MEKTINFNQRIKRIEEINAQITDLVEELYGLYKDHLSPEERNKLWNRIDSDPKSYWNIYSFQRFQERRQ